MLLAGGAAAYTLVLQNNFKQQYLDDFAFNFFKNSSENLQGKASNLNSSKNNSQKPPDQTKVPDSPEYSNEEIQDKNKEREPYEEQAFSPWEWAKNQKKLYQLDPDRQEQVLLEVNRLFSQKSDRIKALSFLRLDTPYQFGCLGEGAGRTDPDPVFRLDVTDCTAFVLTNMALLNAQDVEQAEDNMKIANYRARINPKTGQKEYQLSFEERLHFTTDRNNTSPLFEDITSNVVSSHKLKREEIVLNKIQEDGTRIININWQKQIEFVYIPNSALSKETLNRLPEATGVAFVKEDYFQLGLDVAHEGFLFDRSLLVHASSEQNKVVAVDFLNYYFGRQETSRFDGIIVFNLLAAD